MKRKMATRNRMPIYEDPPLPPSRKVQWSGYGPLGNISQKPPQQPPAEGAEAFAKSKGLNVDYVKGIDLFLNPKYTVIDLMTEFAAQPQLTAEGAEEISDKEIEEWANGTEKIEDFMPMTLQTHIKKKIESRIEGAKWYRLHAQKIADKMVSENIKSFLIWLEREEYNVDFEWDDNLINEYLKSRDSHE
jgi:hypothetical protein